MKRSRRAMLQQSACGFGLLAASELMQREALAGAVQASGHHSAGGVHHPARAKRVIFLFMHGGPSQVDTFDYKPKLQQADGEKLPFAAAANIDAVPKLMRSPWKFAQHGQSGLWVSELFPEVAKCVDDLCIIRSMHSKGQSHGQAVAMLNTGSDNFVRPSMGAWISYGLGSENADLPAFVAISPATAHGGPRNYGAAFLPARHQATAIGRNGRLGEGSIPHLFNAELPQLEQRKRLEWAQRLSQQHLSSAGSDAQIEGAIESMELAFRMQQVAPSVLNLDQEPAHIKTLYGLDDKTTENFGKQCLLARRLVEAGVRFIQISSGQVWDQHGGLREGHAKNALATDRPIAGMLRDLKARGLLDDTLIVWSGEFGRTPIAQGKDGRDHNPQGFTAWLAGGGVRGGLAYGETDEYGYYSVSQRVHMHDLHATILHILGVDHERLTFPYAGREFRLTDVYGQVVHELLA